MIGPQVLTITAWPVKPKVVKKLAAKHGQTPFQEPMALMSMHSANLKSITLCHMGAFILRELGRNFGLERASEIVFQTAQTMTMRSQFKEEQEPPYDPASEFGDDAPWDDDDDDDYPTADDIGGWPENI